MAEWGGGWGTLMKEGAAFDGINTVPAVPHGYNNFVGEHAASAVDRMARMVRDRR